LRGLCDEASDIIKQSSQYPLLGILGGDDERGELAIATLLRSGADAAVRRAEFGDVGVEVGVGVEILWRGRAQRVSSGGAGAVGGVVHSWHGFTLSIVQLVSARGREVKRRQKLIWGTG